MFKPVIKWSGSKRSQSAKIKEYLPDKFNRYYEPFIGGGSMLYAINPTDAVCGDICVNGLIRFNANGDFNNSLHHTRPGISPDSLEKIIMDWSKHIQGSEFIAADYTITTETAKEGDLIYLDPPYFHTKGRYYGTIDFDAFLAYLEQLNSKGIKYMLSFDGIRGEDDFTVELPKELYKRHEFIPSGNSSFKKVMDKESIQVLESLYLNW